MIIQKMNVMRWRSHPFLNLHQNSQLKSQTSSRIAVYLTTKMCFECVARPLKKTWFTSSANPVMIGSTTSASTLTLIGTSKDRRKRLELVIQSKHQTLTHRYICRTCWELEGIQYNHHGPADSTDNYEPMTEDEFVSFFTQGKCIVRNSAIAPVNMEEREMLLNIYWRIKLWTMEAK